MPKGKKSAYASAGVNIDEQTLALAAIKRMVRSTSRQRGSSSFGAFGGTFPSPGRDHVIVASTDSVGTKVNVAVLSRRYDTVGQDIVNHCVNDILVQGACPMFFLDYLGVGKLKARILSEIVSGISRACRANECELLGGETAELPGLYAPGEFDLVGTIIGSVPRGELITGARIRPGDVLVGLPSSGLHTNGYTLARKIIFQKSGLKPSDQLPGTSRRVSDILLAVHRSYLKPVKALMRSKVPIHGLAHITGGGFVDNIPRVLPKGTSAVVHTNSWRVPPLFRFLQERGHVSAEEMYRVFNMGIGYIIIVPGKHHETALTHLRKARANPKTIGYIEKGRKSVRLV